MVQATDSEEETARREELNECCRIYRLAGVVKGSLQCGPKIDGSSLTGLEADMLTLAWGS
jgi:hypothetical protein